MWENRLLEYTFQMWKVLFKNSLSNIFYMISKIKLFVLDCFAWGRDYKQLCCCLLSVYYLYSHLMPYFLLDHVKLQDSKNHLRYSLPRPWKSVGTIAWSESITACSFSAAWSLELGYAFVEKAPEDLAKNSGNSLKTFPLTLQNSQKILSMVEKTQIGKKTKQNNQTTIENKQTCKTEQHIVKLSLRYQNPVPVKKPFQEPVLMCASIPLLGMKE